MAESKNESKTTVRKSSRRKPIIAPLADLSAVGKWRRRSSDDRVASVRERLRVDRDEQRESDPSHGTRDTGKSTGQFVVVMQTVGFASLACALALALFAVLGRSDLAIAAGGFAVAGAIFLCLAMIGGRNEVKPTEPTAPRSRRTARRSETARKSEEEVESPWRSLDARLQRLVNQLEEPATRGTKARAS